MSVVVKVVEYPGEKVVSLHDLTEEGLENARYQARRLIEDIECAMHIMRTEMPSGPE